MRIITVTLSPVFDRTVWIREFTAGKTYLAERSETYAGGKGVNVSRALHNLSIQSTASGMLGDEGSNAYCRILILDGIDHDFYITKGGVRTNITVVSPETGKETHIRERGPSFSHSILDGLVDKLLLLKEKPQIDDTSSKDDATDAQPQALFVFAGRLPAGLPQDTYRKLIEKVHSWSCLSVLDTSGLAFKNGIAAAPLFIKPNTSEVEAALGFRPVSKKELIRAVDRFHDMGIKRVMISKGRDGIVYSFGSGISRAVVPVEHPVNTVGSGDCVVAGGIIGIIQNLSDEDTARLACAMGAANTLISGAGRFSYPSVRTLMNQVRIEQL